MKIKDNAIKNHWLFMKDCTKEGDLIRKPYHRKMIHGMMWNRAKEF